MTGGPVIVIGGGLAGSEAAWALAQRGIDVELFEMRPRSTTPAHRTGNLAELVCSNSFRGAALHQAPGLLKEEMRRLGSLVMQAAAAAEVPAGGALAVDRELFSAWITERINGHPRIRLRRERVDALPDSGTVIVATGPLTASPLQEDLERRLGSTALAFYDAIAPVVTRDSIDWNHAYLKDRWQDDTTDAAYVNCPLDRDTYERFVERILAGPFVPYKPFEENIRHFEGCLPIEEMAARGIDTLRHGPMKPVGLKHPVTGELPWAVVQLRPDNRAQSLLNLVGFQTKMTWDAQKEAFRMIPALRNATFVRLGSMHRNTFIDSPRLLDPDLSWRADRRVRFAGQMTGVEGYIESAVSGLIAGLAVAAERLGCAFAPPPPETATGALLHYISDPVVEPFQPMNVNFGLFPPLRLPDGKRLPRGKARRALYAERALVALDDWRIRHAALWKALQPA